MTRYCLDTSTYSHFRRGDEEVTRLLDQAAWIGMPAIVLGELRTGFKLGSHRDRNERMLGEFLDNGAVRVLAVDGEVSRHYADIVADLRTVGRPIPTNDAWIAAVAANEGAVVLTYDDHFEDVVRVGSIVLGDGGAGP